MHACIPILPQKQITTDTDTDTDTTRTPYLSSLRSECLSAAIARGSLVPAEDRSMRLRLVGIAWFFFFCFFFAFSGCGGERLVVRVD